MPKSESAEETIDMSKKAMAKPTAIITQEMTLSTEAMDLLKKSVDIVVDEHVKTKLDDLVAESVNKYFARLGVAPFHVKFVDEGIREISLSDAKELILSTISSEEVCYPSDIAEKLNLDLKLVVEAIEELRKEGKIKPVG